MCSTITPSNITKKAAGLSDSVRLSSRLHAFKRALSGRKPLGVRSSAISLHLWLHWVLKIYHWIEKFSETYHLTTKQQNSCNLAFHALQCWMISIITGCVSKMILFNMCLFGLYYHLNDKLSFFNHLINVTVGIVTSI